jgi:hypothetical protein
MNARDRGTTLLELLASIAVFTVLVNTGMQIYIGATRLSDAGTHAMECIADLDDVRDEFYRFTRESNGIVASAGEYTRGASLMLWRLDDERVAILGSTRESAAPVSIILKRQNDAWETIYLKRFPETIASIGFDVPREKSIRMTVRVDNLGMENTVPHENAFLATFRADGATAEITTMGDEL